jgi:hypothetical protein
MIRPIYASIPGQERRNAVAVSEEVMGRDEWAELPSFRRMQPPRRWPRLAGWFGLGFVLGVAGTMLL